MYHFKNLVFEGGGVKGLAYVGAMQVLESRQILQSIQRIGGTSAGAINALLFGLGYSTQEILDVLMGLDFTKFMDDSWGVVRDTSRLLTRYGWYKGDFFRTWISNFIRNKTGSGEATFLDLRDKGFRDVYFVGTNLSTGLYEVFSFEHSPKMCVADAVRISMSIPLFFRAPRSERGDVYSDGGILDNYPVKLFDRASYVEENFLLPDYYRTHNQTLPNLDFPDRYVYNQETLGFKLASNTQIGVFPNKSVPQRHSVDNFLAYLHRLVATALNQQENNHLHSDDWQRTIYIDTLGVGTIDFSISLKRKEALVESGRGCAERYFDWYDNPESKPINRP